MPTDDELDEVFENMGGTPEPPTPKGKTITEQMVALAERWRDSEYTEDDLVTIQRAARYLVDLELQLERLNSSETDLHDLLTRLGAPRKDLKRDLSLEERVTRMVEYKQQRVDMEEEKAAQAEGLAERYLIPVFRCARALRDLGYDGPFMGEWVEPLLSAVNKADEQRRW